MSHGLTGPLPEHPYPQIVMPGVSDRIVNLVCPFERIKFFVAGRRAKKKMRREKTTQQQAPTVSTTSPVIKPLIQTWFNVSGLVFLLSYTSKESVVAFSVIPWVFASTRVGLTDTNQSSVQQGIVFFLASSSRRSNSTDCYQVHDNSGVPLGLYVVGSCVFGSGNRVVLDSSTDPSRFNKETGQPSMKDDWGGGLIGLYPTYCISRIHSSYG